MQGEVRYHPDREQLEIVDAFDDSLAALLPIARLHASHDETAEIFAELEALGLFGIAADEAAGGSGLGAAEEALITVGLGRRLISTSVLATIGATHLGALGSLRDGRVLRTAPGYQRAGRTIIVDGDTAELLLVRDEQGAALYEAKLAGSIVVDDKLWLTSLRELSDLGAPVARLDAAQVLRLRLLDAAALAGIAETATGMGVDYAGLREQFGRPIGSFQAIKHHCANMAINARRARDIVSFAAVAIDDGRDDAALQVECALLTAGTAAIENAGKNIQIHGGIGFSDEADPHLLLKRAQLIVNIAGGLEAATMRIADIKPRA